MASNSQICAVPENSVSERRALPLPHLPLQLVLSGTVIRTDGDGTVLKIHRYEFRIRASNGSEEQKAMIRGQPLGT